MGKKVRSTNKKKTELTKLQKIRKKARADQRKHARDIRKLREEAKDWALLIDWRS